MKIVRTITKLDCKVVVTSKVLTESEKRILTVKAKRDFSGMVFFRTVKQI